MNTDPVKQEPSVIKTRKKKPFTVKGKQDFTELLDRIEELRRIENGKPPCLLPACMTTFTEIKEELAKIRQKLDTFLGNGHEGLFQSLEKRVEVNTGRLYRLERWGYAFVAGLMVLNIAIQVFLKHFWVK
jgi:tetrahydromethanopterin S-methyltransferase subunit G